MAIRPMATREANATAAASKGFKLMFATSAYTPNEDADEFVADFKANEATGTNLPAGGVALTHTIVRDDNSQLVDIRFDDVDINNVTATFRSVLIVEAGGNDATDRIWHIQTFGSDQTLTNQPLHWEDPATGAMRF